MHTHNKPWSSPLIRPFYPALDGLRAIAFLSVFACHYLVKVSPWPLLRAGWMGVDLFFVLSGFLITGILFDSLHQPRFFRDFYIRRSLRIFPLFYGFWILLLLLTPLLHILWTRYNFALMAYIGNSFIAGAVLGHHPDPTQIAFVSTRHAGALRYISVGHLWSLCVEEQFYLLWPAIVFLLRSRRNLIALCLACLALLPLGRLAFAHAFPALLHAGALYNNAWSHSDGLLAGAALALWLRGPAPSPRTLRIAALVCFLASTLLIALTLPLPASPDGDFRTCTFGFSLIALACVSLLLLVIASPRPASFLEARPLIATGRISYGLYFFHAIPILYVTMKIDAAPSHAAAWFVIAADLALTYIVAWLSYRFFESPFLRLKAVLAPRRDAVPDPAANIAELTTRFPSADEVQPAAPHD